MAAMQKAPGHSPAAGSVAAKLRRAAAGFCLMGLACLVAAAGNAQEQSRERIADDGALADLLRDQTIHGVYSDGSEWMEYHAADGRSAYWDGCTHPGQWWVAHGMACYRYPGDPSHVDHC